METIQPEEFELLESISTGTLRDELRVSLRSSPRRLRMVRFSPEATSSEKFRGAFRKHLPVLQNIHHGNILPVTGWGELDGQLYLLTELPEGQPLSELLSQNMYSWDEVTDIAWQISSALQHAHNIGVMHGGLTADCVFVSDQLRVQVADFEVQSWMAAVEQQETFPSIQLPIDDLRQLGRVLESLLQHLSESAADEDHRETQFQKMRQLANQLKSPVEDLIARDVQGWLGNLLLKDAGDAIEIVDDRKGQNLSRRSLVAELFDSPPSPRPELAE
ncbi:MAG: protein kinase, partial [Fuerstiella sp.]